MYHIDTEKFVGLQLNVEGCRQETDAALLAFLLELQPHLITLQEAFPCDVERIASLLGGMATATLPMMNFDIPNAYERISHKGPWGVAILSKFPMQEVHRDYYIGDSSHIETYIDPDNWRSAYGVLSATISCGSHKAVVATTHFPVSLDGEPDDMQRTYLPVVEEIIEQRHADVSCADMNLPMQKELGRKLTRDYWYAQYPDCITSTLTSLHRKSPPPEHIVDYVLTPHPQNRVGSMEVSDKLCVNTTVSDHAALVYTFRFNGAHI